MVTPQRLRGHRFRRTGKDVWIEFDGEAIKAIEGETLAAALTAAGKRTLGWDRTARPRGLFCGMGTCFDCLVDIEGRASQRACLTKVARGMRIRSRPYCAEAMPSSIEPPERHDKTRRSIDVLIIGAGPAGLSAAAILANSGFETVVLDERPDPGGQFFKQLANSHRAVCEGAGDRQYEEGARLIQQVLEAGADIQTGVNVWGAFRLADGQIEIASTAWSGAQVWLPSKLILATGAYEEAPAFPGWTLPGVMTTGAAQTLCRAYRVSPGRRIVIAGNGPLNLQLACELSEGGAEVAALVEAAPAPGLRMWRDIAGAVTAAPGLVRRGIGYRNSLRRRSVPILHRHTIVAAEGDVHVERVVVAAVDSDGLVIKGTERSINADTLTLGYRLRPSNELSRVLGCVQEVGFQGYDIPMRNDIGLTSLPNVYVVGDGAHIEGAQSAMAEGEMVARAIVGSQSLKSVQGIAALLARSLRARHRLFQRSLWSLYRAPWSGVSLAHSDTPICRCEGVTVSDIESVIRQGVCDPDTVKRLTRAGMGRCQGRYCNAMVGALVESDANGSRRNPSVFSQQNPVKPAPVRMIASEKREWSGYRPVLVPAQRSFPHAHQGVFHETEVLVIGAGVIGISTAYYLSQDGVSVAVVERGEINGEASGGNAGSLHLQLLYFDHSASTDTHPAAETLPLQHAGIRLWQQLEKELDVDLELKITGGLMVAESPEDMAFLQAKVEVEGRHGVATTILSKSDMQKMEPAVADRMIGAAYCSGEGKLNPLIATPAIAAAAEDRGAAILKHTEVFAIEQKGSGFSVSTDRGRIVCRCIVNAAGAWSTTIANMVGTALPVRSAPQQMIVTEATKPLISQLISHAHRHLTMKQSANGNLIIGGGWFGDLEREGGRPKTTRDGIEGNLWVAQRVVPDLSDLHVIRSWASVGVSIDGAPILGESPSVPGFFSAVGANGYTMGPIMGRETAAMIMTGKGDFDLTPFSIKRFAP